MSGRRQKLLSRCSIEPLEVRALLSTIYVDANAAGMQDGASWTTAYQDLSVAIAAANPGDEIHVAGATYKPTSTTDRTISFQLKENVSILGGYAGSGGVDPDQRDVGLFPTILSGEIGDQLTIADNSYHVVVASSVSATAILDGVTIRDGNYPNGSQRGGGGLINLASRALIRNCVFTHNSTTGLGAAVHNDGTSAPTFESCRFIENTGIYVPGLPSFAGGIYNATGAAPMVLNCDFIRNRGSAGGAVYDGGGKGVYFNCRFEGNSNINGGERGGAMFIKGGAQSIIQCIFVGNHSNLFGGAIEIQGSAVRFTNCVFVANYGTTNIFQLFLGASPVFTNCMLWNNSTPGTFVSNSDSTITFKNSVVQGGWAGVGNIDADPLFVRNPDPGGDLTWGTSDDDYGDLRLQASSPCIDSGSNPDVPFAVLTDLGADPRFSDRIGVNDPGSIVDIGAYEFQEAATLTAVNGSFLYDSLPHAVRIGFSGPLDSSTIAAADLSLVNLDTMQSLDVNSLALSVYDASTFSIAWNFGSPLPKGNYRASIAAGAVSKTGGEPLANSLTFDFFVMPADANRDRVVNLFDLVILATNWQRTGATFSQGDFDYNGVVNSADLGILAANWNTRIDPPPPASPPIQTAARRPAARTPTRTLALVNV